jgi:hypothetical protein
MVEQTPQIAGDRDRVFNAETCRALRRKARSRESVTALMLALALVPLSVIGWLFPNPVLRMFLGIAYFVTVIIAGVWLAMPPREVRHELKREAVWTVAQTVGLEQKLPPESEYRPSTDTDDHDPEPPARPALALGRSARDWFVSITPPVMALYVAMSEQGMSLGFVLLLGVVAAAGPAMFWETRASNTYPPEGPP